MNSLYLENITVVNYKNILNKVYDFDKNINCFVGDNGVGKTNILDSIYFKLNIYKTFVASVKL